MARNEESWHLMVARRIGRGEDSLERIDDIAAESYEKNEERIETS